VDSEPTLTMLPPPRLHMNGIVLRVRFAGPLTFTEKKRCQSSSVASNGAVKIHALGSKTLAWDSPILY